ncbi:uncharacterized protein RCC_06817 [Ramularia collo-cygni]|uniref:Chromo domain-containing protein n=1 Tax=Ramularia collo-cygni TaxID=112498 RepID=A0A2D3VB97_9PEZI|nr:uncharacterized protein RCC_06817 [Ramularia collo-cygni]CZT20956.1 uncharacterized protein RCC_06817 [Ramularia collo-cygni]
MANAKKSDSDVAVEIPASKPNTTPAEDEDEEEDYYEVEKIFGHRTVKGEIEYRVKWLGYVGDEEKTWEPKLNVVSAAEALQAYHAQIGGVPHPSGSSLEDPLIIVDEPEK